MTKTHARALALAAAGWVLGITTAGAGPAYDEGVRWAQEHRYGPALEAFRDAARQGDREAMRITGLMLLYGQRLYGSEVAGSRAEALAWLRAAAAAGCEVSAHIVRYKMVASSGASAVGVGIAAETR